MTCIIKKYAIYTVSWELSIMAFKKRLESFKAKIALADRRNMDSLDLSIPWENPMICDLF